MKKHVSCVLFLLFAGFSFALAPAQAQDDAPTLYFVVDYMKVPPGDGAEYVEVEREIWKPIHEERLKRGLIRGWTLYDVSLSGMDTPYGYATVNVYDDLEKMMGSFSNEIIAAAHPDATEAEREAMMNRTGAARHLIHNEVWQQESAAEGNASAEWIVVNQMQVPPGGGEAYMAVENEVWKPVHDLAIAEGKRRGWSVYSRVLPYGAALGYNYATVDGYDSMGDVVAPGLWDLFLKAHAGATEDDIEEMTNRTMASRTLLQGQLWHRLDHVDASTMGSN